MARLEAMKKLYQDELDDTERVIALLTAEKAHHPGPEIDAEIAIHTDIQSKLKAAITALTTITALHP